METYDPDQPVDPQEWTTLDESERQQLVERFHRQQRIKLPNLKAHAAFHVIVENQVALGGETPAQETLARLMREGLTRHDAVHAIGSVLSEHMLNLMKSGRGDVDPNAEYFRSLEKLTAEGWRKSYS